eukprot:TRINITY_DN2059_c0_g1_i2.p2 TRINITY_DN2059_c0_g1~~TRINITY_DN2059_c0_g1_i2.p2  ORF type:complete len:209 (+),score=12.20 TRINITY_DN2059_c0_g1_i2:265-891(+)
MQGALPSNVASEKIGQQFMEIFKAQNVIQKNLEAAQDLRKALAGAVSGAVSKTIVAPLTRMTILYQVQSYQNKGFVGLPLHQALIKVVEQQGVLALWRGNLVSVIHRVPNQAIGFYVQENVRDSLDPYFAENAKGDFVKGLISGTIAGVTSCSMVRHICCHMIVGVQIYNNCSFQPRVKVYQSSFQSKGLYSFSKQVKIKTYQTFVKS